MACYAAVLSLRHTIARLHKSSHISFVTNSSQEILQLADNEVELLQELLLLLDLSTSNRIRRESQIVSSSSAFDLFQHHLSNHFPLQYKIIQFTHKHVSPLQKLLDGCEVRVKYDSRGKFEETVEKIRKNLVSIRSKYERSQELIEEEIISFTETVMTIKEYIEPVIIKQEEDVEFYISLIWELAELLMFALDVLKDVLQKLDKRSNQSSKKLNALDDQIREEACKLEDALESHVSNQILLQTEYQSSFSLDLQDLKRDIDLFTRSVKKLKEEYINEFLNPLNKEDNDDDDDDGDCDVVSSIIDIGGKKKPKIFGFSDELSKIRDVLTSNHPQWEELALFGMAGIGKTTLAKELFEDSTILERFKIRVWVTIGQKYGIEKIMPCIQAQVNFGSDDKKILEGDVKLAEYLYERLNGRMRCLFVFDDVWDSWFSFRLNRSRLPKDCRVRVLLTTRIRPSLIIRSRVHEVRFLNKGESWDLLRDKVFGEESCPPHLINDGKKIAENCEGLPLTIVTIAGILSRVEKTAKSWNKIAEREDGSIFADAYDQMSKVLYPSYEYLSKYSGALFLYAGVYPKNHEFTRSKLIKLWISEGFLDQFAQTHDPTKILGLVIDELLNCSLLMTCQMSPSSEVKTFKVHSSFQYLCRREAEKNKFFHIINSWSVDAASANIQRRLCIHNTILFSIKDVRCSIASFSTARSLLCSGSPDHKYPVPVCFGLKLLRILDAIIIRFYEFPMEVLKLVLLRYLALTFYGDLPSSIYKLLNLEFLIVRQNLIIKSSGSPSYMPLEIWDMKELKHLQVTGSDLREPFHDALLPNLLKLLDVSAHSCTKSILERVPNLRKLGIRIELVPDGDAHQPLSCFDHISHLHRLKSLKCAVVNLVLRSDEIVSPLPIYSTSLVKLSLSGLGYPWESMRVIASLPNLQVLKLRCYAFRGPKWEIQDNEFLKLGVLLIEDTDLVQWTATPNLDPMTSLSRLSLRHCYKLREIPDNIFYRAYATIEVIECHPLYETLVKRIKEDPRMKEYNNVHVHSSCMG